MRFACEIPFRLPGYRVIVADPPWSYDDQASRLAPDYHGMTEEEIAEMPVAGHAACRSILFLWVTAAHLASALVVMAAWGYGYRTQGVWVKTTIDGRPKIGGGHYLRLAHEPFLVGVRGGFVPSSAARPCSVIMAPRRSLTVGARKHSTKPEELQDNAEKMAPGPYLELFARRVRPGWTCLGDET